MSVFLHLFPLRWLKHFSLYRTIHGNLEDISDNCVYLITNDVCKDVYVGQTQIGMMGRWKLHVKDCKKGTKVKLYNLMRKLGIERFVIIPLEYVREEDMKELGTKARRRIGKQMVLSTKGETAE